MPTTIEPNYLCNLPTELLLLITAHLPNRYLSRLSSTCHTLHTRLDHLLTQRFTAACPSLIYRLCKSQWRFGRCYRVPDYDRRVDLLNYAADKGCTAVVRRLVQYHGVPVDGDGCLTPLVRALRGGHVETVKLLLESAASDPGVWSGDTLGKREMELEKLVKDHRQRVWAREKR